MPRLILLRLVMLAAIGLSACAGKNRIQTSADRVASTDVRRRFVTATMRGGALHGDGRRPAPRRHGDPDDAPAGRHAARGHEHPSLLGPQGHGARQGPVGGGEVQVTLADAHEGQPFLANTMKVYSITQKAATANEALAEAIAARIRFTYALKVPPVRPAAYAAPKLATVVDDRRRAAGPVVIPADTASGGGG